jgi:HEAT repeat protein
MPDLSKLSEPPGVYFERHRVALEQGDFQARATAAWGLIANGAASLPFVERMLQSASPDAREDAAGILRGMARHDPRIVDHLLVAVESETDVQALDSIVMALGELRDKRSVPALARLFRDPRIDGDSRSLVVHSLGQVVRHRFDKQADPEAAVGAWLEKHAGSS